jgi:hypothetical protein
MPRKSASGQSRPQIMRWIASGVKKDGSIKYIEEERPYKKRVDAKVVGKPVGYRFTDAGAKKLGKSATARPTKAEIEQYKGKKVRGSNIIYRETRSNKSDVNPRSRM